MVAPKPNDRAEMLARDGGRCVSCGATTALEAQHRGAVGMGGSKVAPRLDELLTACAPDNAAYEGAMQRVALLKGWKVRRWVVEQGIAYRVPVFYAMDRGWYLVDRGGGAGADQSGPCSGVDGRGVRGRVRGVGERSMRVHLVWVGDVQNDPCRRCGRHLQSMNGGDGFTFDPAEATCEARS